MLKLLQSFQKKITSFAPNSTVRAFLPRSIRALAGNGWLALVMELHASARDTLPNGLEKALLPRDAAYFAGFLEGRTGPLLGLVDHGRLLSFVALAIADHLTDARQQGFLTFPDRTSPGADEMPDPSWITGTVAIVQSLCVGPAFRGQGHAVQLIRAAVAEARQHGASHIFAQVAAANATSCARFESQGFGIVARWTDGHERVLMKWTGTKDCP